MVAEIRKKFRANIAVQSAKTLTSGATPLTTAATGTTLVDLTYDSGSENGLGAEGLSLTYTCTAQPATTGATGQIWYRESMSSDQSDVTRWRYSHTIGENILTSTESGTTEVIYDAGIFIPGKPFVELAMAAVSYGFSGHLDATPFIYEAQ